MEPGLYVVATPIGNLKDITLRALDVLKSADFILCEDTRRTKQLLKSHGVEQKKLVSFHKFNEKRKSDFVLDRIKEGKIGALVSDSGTPAISDPGAFIVEKCLREGIRVYPVPGPSSLCAGVSCSGIEGGFIFLGFLGKKKRDLEKLMNLKKEVNLPIVFFESPNRIIRTFERFSESNYNGFFIVWREMTKIYEEVIMGTAGQVLNKLKEKNKVKGEFLVVLK